MATDNEGNTPLHLCCANGHDDCVKALVFYEASMKRLQINVTNEFGDTALHLAAKWGYETIVKTLLENGADATVCNRKKQTPVSLAQNVKVQRCLQVAAEDPDFMSAKLQFVNSSSHSRSRASSSSSVTNQHAAYTGHRSGRLDLYEPEPASSHVVTTSLEVVTESQMKRKREKLFKAVIEGDIQLVKFYLGVQPEVDDGKDDDMDSLPLSLSLSDMCHPLCQCEKCLYIQRASRKWGDIMSVNSKTSTGYCPIHVAVLHNHKDVAALLISHGADVSAQNHRSLTPLHLAICTRNTLMTDMLVKAGARLNVCDVNGDTPLLMAASNGFIDGINILLKANADLSAANHKGNTALHEAVKRNYTAIVSTLLHAGADPRIRNKHGHLPQDESNDVSLRGVLVAATRRLEEAEKLSQNNNNTSGQNSLKGTDGQVSIKELFAAFEEKDIQKLQSLASAIRSFDQQVHLKRAKTKDASTTFLGFLTRNHLIHTFDRGTLRKTKSLCNSEPHLYSVSKSQSFDTPSTDRLSTVTLTSNELSTDNVSQDLDVGIQEPLTPMGDQSFDAGSGFDDSLNPVPESESLNTSESDISSEPPENDTSLTVQASNKADIPATVVLSNYTSTRNSCGFTSGVQPADDVCSVSQPLELQPPREMSLVVVEVANIACEVSSCSSHSVNTQSSEVNSSLTFECNNEVNNSVTFENGAEVNNSVNIEHGSEVTNSSTFKHADVVDSSLNLEHGNEDINSLKLECGSEDKNSLNLECGNEDINSLNLECGSKDNNSLSLECGREDKNSLYLECGNEANNSLFGEDKNALNLKSENEDKTLRIIADGSDDNSFQFVEHGGEDKNSLHLECGHEANNSPIVEHGSEDKTSLHLQCANEVNNSLIVEHGREDKYPRTVEPDSNDEYSLTVEHAGEDKSSLNLQQDTRSQNYQRDTNSLSFEDGTNSLPFEDGTNSLPFEDGQTDITSHCKNGAWDSQSENLVNSLSQISTATE